MRNTESKNLAKNNQSPTISLQHEKFFHWRAYLQRLLLDSPISSEHPKKKKEIKFINKKDLNHIFYKDK